MEPYQARLTLFVFLTLSAFIVFNALYMQADPGLSVRSPVRYAAVGGLPAVRQQPRESVLVQAVRRELDSRNYFTGEGDSAMLTGAVMAYQYDQGLAIDGIVSDDLLKSFLFGIEAAGDRDMREPRIEGETARRLVAEVQGILSGNGYYSGEIDGLIGPSTAAAIRRYETDRSLPVTGRISGLLVQELSRSTGVRLSGGSE